MALGFDEMRGRGGTVREHYRGYDRWLSEQPPQVMQSRREEAEVIFRRVGITFAVYGAKDEDGQGTERLIPVRPDPARDPGARVARDGAGLRAARARR